METLKATYDFLHFAVEYNLTRAGIDVRDERGAVSTEMAVVIAALVAIAVAWRWKQVFATILAGLVSLHAFGWLAGELQQAGLL